MVAWALEKAGKIDLKPARDFLGLNDGDIWKYLLQYLAFICKPLDWILSALVEFESASKSTVNDNFAKVIIYNSLAWPYLWLVGVPAAIIGVWVMPVLIIIFQIDSNFYLVD